MQGCAAESDNFLRIAVDAEEKSKYYVKEYSVLALCGRYLIFDKKKGASAWIFSNARAAVKNILSQLSQVPVLRGGRPPP